MTIVILKLLVQGPPRHAGTDSFLNVEQIIPTPEASGSMIGMLAKEAEEKNASDEQKHRHTLRLVSVFVVPTPQRRVDGKASRMIDSR